MSTSWGRLSLTLIGILAIASLLVAISAHAYIGLFARYNADDYCFAKEVFSRGFLGAQRFWYVQWRGVYSHTFAISLASLAGSRIASYLPSMVLGLWLVGLIWAIWQFILMFGFRRPLFVSILVAEVVLFGTVYTAPNIVQSLYWQSGMFSYTAPLLFLVAYSGFVAYAARRWPVRTAPLSLIPSVALPFVAGGFSETYVALQTGGLFLALVLAAVVLKREAFRHTTFRLIVGGLVGSLLALVLVILAPGNAVRQARFPLPPSVLSIFGHSLYYSLRFVGSSVLRSPLGTILLVAGPALLAFQLYPQTGRTSPASPRRLGWSAVRILIVLPVVGLFLIVLSFAPSLYGMSIEPQLRTRIEPEFIFVCMLVLWGIVLGSVIRERGILGRDVSAGFPISACVFIIGSLAFGAPLASAQRALSLAPQVREYASRWDARDRELRDAKLSGKHAVNVPALGYTGGLQDLHPEPSHWVNSCIAGYYGLDSVRAERSSTEDFPLWLTEGKYFPIWLKVGE